MQNKPYHTKIDIKYGDLKNVMQWCKDNCANEWTFNVEDYAGEKAGTYEFRFASEKDYVSFLVWKR